MPEIMRQFGQTIIVAVGGVLLIALLFVLWPSGSGSALDDMGERAGGHLAERTVTGVGTENFGGHSERSVPKAAVKGSVQQGIKFVLLDQFTVTDSDGALWNQSAGRFILNGAKRGGVVQVESIVSADGTEHIGGLTGTYTTDKLEMSQSTGKVEFKEPGVYRVRLRVLDFDNVEATYTIPVVVDFKL